MTGPLTLCTGADAGYFPLLRDMIQSVRDCGPADLPVSVLDLGLSAEQGNWLRGQGARLVTPGWDIDFPAQATTNPALRAMVSRPFLRKHFPGYQTYLWVDADTWVQDWSCLELYLDACRGGRLAIAAEIDRCYKRHFKSPKLFGWTLTHKSYRQAFGWRVAHRLGRNPMVNSGVFALEHDAPHWDRWIAVMTGILQRTQFFLFEQIALNYVLYGEGLPFGLMPAWCNWMVGDALPIWDGQRQRLVEPQPPHQPLGVIHLAGPDQKAKTFAIPRRDGGPAIERRLRYEDLRPLVRGGESALTRRL